MSGMKDFKKTFFRVKQKADQKLGTAEKSEVLTDDMLEIEQQIGLIQSVCHTTYKKVKGSYPGIGVHDPEKRKKKSTEYGLASHFEESSNTLQDSLYGAMYDRAGRLETSLAFRMVEMEKDLEEKVLESIAQLTDVEIPNILKLRKTLAKHVLDKDVAQNKFVTAQSDVAKGKIVQAKVDAVKQDYEEAQIRVEQSKDQLSMELCTFAAKEGQYCQFLINFVEIHAKFYKEAYQLFEKELPGMKEQCEKERVHPIFGVALEDHLRHTEKDISFVIEQCIGLLDQYGLKEEGMFRIAGGSSKVKKIKSSFDAHVPLEFDETGDIHCVGGVLKQYLRELPEPLLTFKLYDDWIRAAQLPHDEKMTTLWAHCQNLPKDNYNNLKYLIKFLSKLVQYSELNKMTSSNVAIVMGPNLLWSKDESQSMMSTGAQSAVVESLITHADYFFPGDVDFTLRESGTPTGTLRSGGNPLNAEPAQYDNSSLSTHNLQNSAESLNTKLTSPYAARKGGKKPAPPPPPFPERHAPGPPSEATVGKSASDAGQKTERKTKHERSQSGNLNLAEKPIERPTVPPPAPPKPHPEGKGGGLKPSGSDQAVNTTFRPPPSPARPERPKPMPERPERPNHRRDASGGDKVVGVKDPPATAAEGGNGTTQQHNRTGSDGTQKPPGPKPPRPAVPPPPTGRAISREGSAKGASNTSIAGNGAPATGNGAAATGKPPESPSPSPKPDVPPSPSPKPELPPSPHAKPDVPPPSPQHKSNSLPSSNLPGNPHSPPPPSDASDAATETKKPDSKERHSSQEDTTSVTEGTEKPTDEPPTSPPASQTQL